MNPYLTNWKMNFNSKNHWKRCFAIKTKASKSFIPMKRICLWCLIIKRKEIILWIHVYPIEKWTLFLKMVEKDVFLMKPEPFIPMRRMCLWCLIMKWKEIIMWIHVYPNCKTNFNSRNGRKRSISYETKASIHLS